MVVVTHADIETAIANAIGNALFEPNDEKSHQKVKAVIEDWMTDRFDNFKVSVVGHKQMLSVYGHYIDHRDITRFFHGKTAVTRAVGL